MLCYERLLANPGLTIVCPDSRVWADLAITYADTHTRVVYAPTNDDDTLAGAVIPGWFRKDRMADLLMPPETSPLFLVFYDIEQEWYSAFRREGRKARKRGCPDTPEQRCFRLFRVGVLQKKTIL